MVRREIISCTENDRLQETVDRLLWLRERGEDCSSEFRQVRQRSCELIYGILRDRLLVDEDEAGTILLEIIGRIDRIIYSYRLTEGSYTAYLTGVARMGARHLHGRGRRAGDNVVAYSDHLSYDQSCAYSPDPQYEVGRLSRSLDEGEHIIRSFSTLDEVISLITAHVPRYRYFADGKLQRLYRHLSKPRARRDFVILILLLKEEYTAEFIHETAEILDVDVALTAALDQFRSQYRQEAKARQEKMTGIKDRHWSRYIALCNSIAREEDPEKREELERLRDLTLSRVHENCRLIARISYAVPLAELCPLLSMSRESVYNAVRRERAFLQRVDCSTSLLWELEVIPEK